MRTGKISSRSYADGIDRVITKVVGESMTRQDQAAEVNINNIYAKTQRGEIVLASQVMPDFGDYSQVDSYDSMLERIMEAEEAFMELPALERKKYDHDPAKYYESKLEEAKGIIKDANTKEAKQKAKAEHDEKVQQAKELLATESVSKENQN